MAGKFNYKTRKELEDDIKTQQVDIRLSDNLSILSSPLDINGHHVENRFAILPMEGCDSEFDGSPSFFVTRRYLRFFLGGAALVWWEANAVVDEGRANERQMMITDDNENQFKALLDMLKSEAISANGYKPLSILQLTHSGRYSRPCGHIPRPLVPQSDPILDARTGVTSDNNIVSDEYLESLIPHYVHSALLAKEAGFDGVDIKACHRYLLSELLASHTRKGKYGGAFENRISLILEIIRAVKKAVGNDFIIASRFNVFDAHPYPYGFGEDRDDFWKFDDTEPILFVKSIIKEGVSLLSNSAGNPYYIYPQVTRPFDTSSQGIPVPEEHQLKSIERLFSFTSKIQQAAGDIPVIGNGYSWMREFIPNVGSANIEDGKCKMIGLGREAIAYPNAPNDVFNNKGMKHEKCCITCSKCTQMMRDHGLDGCVVRDSGLYAPIYRKQHLAAEEREKNA